MTRESMMEIVDLWAADGHDADRPRPQLMERLARAQLRKAGGAEKARCDEIKRLELDTAWGENGPASPTGPSADAESAA